MQHKRLTNPVSNTPSINPDEHGGRGTKVRINSDRGLTSDRRPIQKIVRGGVEVAPAQRVLPDLIQAGRTNVIARSGNDHRLHDESHIPNGGMWTAVGMGDEVQPQPNMKGFLVAAALFGGLWFLVKGGR